MRIFNFSLDNTFVGLFLVNIFKCVSSLWSSRSNKTENTDFAKPNEVDNEEVKEPPAKKAKLTIEDEVKSIQATANILTCYDHTTDYPFLIDPYTANYILSSKVIFLMRGLPGSGKSYLVRLLKEVYRDAVVCSADHYFMKNGSYEFDASQLQYAHAECQEHAEKSCSEGNSVIIVDNTNVRKWEMSFYLDLARRMNYVVMEVIPKTPWKMDAKELAVRTKHGVPYNILRKKVQSFQDCVPLYYGWFLNEKDSDKLLNTGQNILKECLQKIPKLHKLLSQERGDDKENLDCNDMMTYFNREGATGILHCTAKFCLNGKIFDAVDYHRQEIVKSSCGRAFPIIVSGFTITTQTISARIHLNNAQLSLYNKPEETDSIKQCSVHDSSGQNGLWNTCDKKSSVKCLSNYCFPVKNTGHGRAAHITLGFAAGILAKQAIFDTMDICNLETQISSEVAEAVNISNGCVKYFGAGRCAVYLFKPLTLDSIYSGFY